MSSGNGGSAGRKYDIEQIVRDSHGEPPWVIPGFASKGMLTVLTGSGDQGKSRLMLHLMVGVAFGAEVAGMKCRPGKVLYIDAENGAWIMGNRLSRLEELPPLDRIAAYDGEGLDLRYDLTPIEEIIRIEEPDLAILDSARTLAPGIKENDSDDVGPLMTGVRQLARRTGAAVVLLHHRDKTARADYRGSGAWHDQTDLMFVLETADEDPERAWRRRLRTAKCRIAAAPPTRWIGLKSRADVLLVTEAEPFGGVEAHRDEILELHGEGLSLRNIEERTGVGKSSVARVIKAERGSS